MGLTTLVDNSTTRMDSSWFLGGHPTTRHEYNIVSQERDTCYESCTGAQDEPNRTTCFRLDTEFRGMLVGCYGTPISLRETIRQSHQAFKVTQVTQAYWETSDTCWFQVTYNLVQVLLLATLFRLSLLHTRNRIIRSLTPNCNIRNDCVLSLTRGDYSGAY